MKHYAQTDYAVNKNADGIVYRFANQTVVVTLEDYLRENPDKTAADFAALKAMSDLDYYDTDRADYRQTWKNTPLDTLFEDDAAVVSTPSMEDNFIEREEQRALNARQKALATSALDKLTDVQRRRYLMYHVDGLSMRQIAEREGVIHSKIQNSLESAQKKIKKVLAEG